MAFITSFSSDEEDDGASSPSRLAVNAAVNDNSRAFTHATMLSSDEDNATPTHGEATPTPPVAVASAGAPGSPARTKRGSWKRRPRPQVPPMRSRMSSGGSASSSSSLSGRDQHRLAAEDSLAGGDRHQMEQAARKLKDEVEALNTEVRQLDHRNAELGHRNEELQEQMEVNELSWSSEQRKCQASWDDERAFFEHTVHEWLRMEREDQRAALQRQVVQQINRARNILSHQGSTLVRRSETLADENAKLEEQARCQAAEQEHQQGLVSELRETLLHVERRHAQLEEQVAELYTELHTELDAAERSSREAELLKQRLAERSDHNRETTVQCDAPQTWSPSRKNVEADAGHELAIMREELRSAHAELAEVRHERSSTEGHMTAWMESHCRSVEDAEHEQQQMLIVCGGLEARVNALSAQLQESWVGRSPDFSNHLECRAAAMPRMPMALQQPNGCGGSAPTRQFADAGADLPAVVDGMVARLRQDNSDLFRRVMDFNTFVLNAERECWQQPRSITGDFNKFASLAKNSAATIAALLPQVQGLTQGKPLGEGYIATSGFKMKALHALERDTQTLQHANYEWASLLVERGLASHEWAALLAQRMSAQAANAPATSGPDELERLGHGKRLAPLSTGELERTVLRLGRLQSRLQLMCPS